MKNNPLPKKNLFLLATVAAVFMTGCVVTSVYPYFTEKDLVFEPALIGTWHDAEPDHSEKESWKFEKSGGQSYKFTYQEPDKTNLFSAHLFKLKNQFFLDTCPTQPPDDFIPPHYLLRMNITGSTFNYSVMDYEWLAKFLEKNPGALRHHLVAENPGNEDEKKRLVLTANTAELQAFIMKHLSTEGAFSKTQEMKRRP